MYRRCGDRMETHLRPSWASMDRPNPPQNTQAIGPIETAQCSDQAPAISKDQPAGQPPALHLAQSTVLRHSLPATFAQVVKSSLIKRWMSAWLLHVTAAQVRRVLLGLALAVRPAGSARAPGQRRAVKRTRSTVEAGRPTPDMRGVALRRRTLERPSYGPSVTYPRVASPQRALTGRLPLRVGPITLLHGRDH